MIVSNSNKSITVSSSVLINLPLFPRKILQRFVELFTSTRLLADSTIRKSWDWMILIMSIWATFSVPVQVCFNEKIYYSRDVSHFFHCHEIAIEMRFCKLIHERQSINLA